MEAVLFLFVVVVFVGLLMAYFAEQPTGFQRGWAIFALVVQILGLGLPGAWAMIGGGGVMLEYGFLEIAAGLFALGVLGVGLAAWGVFWLIKMLKKPSAQAGNG